GRSPAAASMRATASAVGVLPAPPTVKFPMQTTGAPAWRPRPPRRARPTAPEIPPRRASRADARGAPPPQNDRSRLGLAVCEPNLHEIGFERGGGALEPATERGHGFARGGGHRRAGVRVLEPGARPQREPLRVAHLFGAMRLVERGVDFRKVPNV